MRNVKKILFVIVIVVLLTYSSAPFLNSASQIFAQPENPYLVKTFIDDDGNQIDEVIFPGRPPDIKALAVELPEPDIQMGINILGDIPAFDWSYGCSPTAAAMLFGYYDRTGYSNMYAGPTNGGVCPLDNNTWGETFWPSGYVSECPLSATHDGIDGRTIYGHVDDYWVDYLDPGPDPFVGNWTEHTYGDCTGDFMGTNQSTLGNVDGSTIFYFASTGDPLYDYTGNPGNGCHGMRLFAESRGYSVITNYSQYIKGEGSDPNKGFTYDDFMSEIDAGWPVLIHLEGHTMLGYGYNDTTSDIIYIHDTWDHSDHTMTWGGTYGGYQHRGVTVIQLDAGAEMDVQGLGFSIADGDTIPDLSDGTDFGSADIVTDTIVHTFTIKNIGPADLNLTGKPIVVLTGSSDFSVTAQSTTPVAAGSGTTTFDITFDPSTSGDHTATVSIANDDTNENPYNFDIKGTGTAPLYGLLRIQTSPAVPTRIFIDSIPRCDWGLDWVKMPPGTYYLSFSDVFGFNTPIEVDVTYYPGSGPTTQPPSSPVEILADTVTEVVVNFIPLGNLRVETNPALPVTIYADGNPMNDWGFWSNIEPGDYTITFQDMDGYITPSTAVATVNSGETTHIIGDYQVEPSETAEPFTHGLLRIQTSPAVPTRIFVDGIPRCDWGLDWVKMPPGTYYLSFSDVFGFNTPTEVDVTYYPGSGPTTQPLSSPVEILADTVTEVVVNFIPLGNLRVETNPALPATIYADGNPMNDWGFWSNIEPGDYTITFQDMDGYITPSTVAATVNPGETTHIIGDYVIDPDMDVQGNSVSIADGDVTPDVSDLTDFGSADFQTGAVYHTFTILNIGSADLNLTGTPIVDITGTHSADFTVTVDPATLVGPSSMTTFTVRFDPSAIGLRQATISIDNDDGDENPYDFSVQGTGI